MLPPDLWLALGFLLAAALAALLWLPRRPRALELVAALLVAYPLGRALALSLSVADRLTRHTVLLPASLRDFERQVLYDASFGVLLPLGGALLLWRARAGRGPARGAGAWRQAVNRALEPAGMRVAWPGRAAALDALALLGLTLGLLALSLVAEQLLPFLVTGDESRYWLNLTPALVVGLSVAAGVSEEFLYRGLLLRALQRRMRPGAALLAQALLFAFIHSGYGNWAHVLGPALFGLLVGLVALRVSLLAAIAVHAGTDMAYLALAAPQLQPAILLLPAALGVAGLAALAATRGRAARAVLRAVRPGAGLRTDLARP